MASSGHGETAAQGESTERRSAEVAPLRRRADTPADKAPVNPWVEAANAPRSTADAEAEVPVITPKARTPAPAPEGAGAAPQSALGGRPIRREEVYRHRVVGGRELRDTPWQRMRDWLREALVSRGEREERELDARLRRPAVPGRMNVIAVVSPKGGVGKTTSSLLVGDALSGLGRLGVCAVDANPDYGTLGALVPAARRSERTLADLLDAREGRDAPTAAQLQPYLSSLESGLRVLEAPSDAEQMACMGPEEYSRLLELLETQMSVVVLDCGTGLASPLARWAMQRAHQVLIVTTPDWVTSNNVSAALKDLPAEKASLVVNQVRSNIAGDRQAISDHFATQAVEERYQLPYDELLRTMLDSGTYELAQAKRPVRLAIKRLAADVGEQLV